MKKRVKSWGGGDATQLDYRTVPMLSKTPA